MALEPNIMPMEIARQGDDSPGGSLTLPNPWLFDSESLIREIDRIRETALQVPCNGDSNATHFGLQQVINTAWTLRENLRFMLGLHRQRQDSFRREESTQHQTIYDLETWANLARNNLLITLWIGYSTH
jgi:hypothetical protein